MAEKNTGELYNASNVDFSAILIISRLDTQDFVYSMNSFDYHDIAEGILTSDFIQYERLVDGTRRCYTGIVCKETGDFENVHLTSSDCIEDIILHYKYEWRYQR